MSDMPAFLDTDRPNVPDIVIPRGVLPFYLPNRPVRGRLIRLGPLADALLTRHRLPPGVATLTGEALALVAGLASALKFRGSFSLRVKGDGPVPMLIADCTDQGALRGYARIDAEALSRYGRMPSAGALLGRGHLALTVDQGSAQDRHQGIVAITGRSLSEMVAHYFETSEQLGSCIRLACAETPDGWRASALLLERVAGDGGSGETRDPAAQEESWRTALLLARTLTDDELLDDRLGMEALVWRLFGAEGVVADQARALSYGCRCSRAKLSGILEGMSAADLDHMAVDGTVLMNCEFCNVEFRFPRQSLRPAEPERD
jgi:molecular chaperone Hsp33